MRVPPGDLDQDGVQAYLRQCDNVVKDLQMAWKTPKIVEIPLGAEINSYASAGSK
jgi:coenzyme PQQ precursor peptide PqqA